MPDGKVILSLLLLLHVTNVETFTYSCEDIRNNLIGKKFDASLTYACVVAQEGFTNYAQLSKMYLSADKKYSFDTIAKTYGNCEGHSFDTAWNLTSDIGTNFDCTQEFSLILSSEPLTIVAPTKNDESYMSGSERTVAVPQTGIRCRRSSCSGAGNVAISTGAGNGEPELEYMYRSWPCASLPNWIISFDIVDTIKTSPGTSSTVYCSSDVHSTIPLSIGDKIAILSSGRSNDQQNLIGTDNRASFVIASGDLAEVTVSMELKFDQSNSGYVILQESPEEGAKFFYFGTYTETFITDNFEVRYVPKGLKDTEISHNQDTIIIEISVAKPSSTTVKTTVPTKTSTAATIQTSSQKPTTHTTAAPLPNKGKLQPKLRLLLSLSGPFCNCAVDKFGFASGWDYNDIWVDVVFILDTSEAMGSVALDDAISLIESFISDGSDNFLISDTTAKFFTRIGVITASDVAEVVYNLNMTKSDKLNGKVTVKQGVNEMNFASPLEAAMKMFADGLKSKPERASARQVIYYITDSSLNEDMTSFTLFKNSQGVIIVNEFLKENEPIHPGLGELASDGFHSFDGDYMQGLQSLCQANCFCSPGMDGYGGFDRTNMPAGGCYHPAPAGVPFPKAMSSCAENGGVIATIHDDAKGRFLQQLLAETPAKSDYFWIGYEKSDDGKWAWEDQSTDPYTNWDVNEPSAASVAKCAYVDTTNSVLPWGAGNCQLGFPHVCQYTPCSVGNKDC